MRETAQLQDEERSTRETRWLWREEVAGKEKLGRKTLEEGRIYRRRGEECPSG